MKKALFRLLPFLLLLTAFAGVAASAVDDATRRTAAVREIARKAAEGDAKALYDLAMLHDMGYDTVPLDSARSTELYRMSAQKGYAPAQNYLGFRYFNGDYVARDVDSALFWLVKAAGNGDAKAAGNLGYLLAFDNSVTRDYPQAIRWLTIAADAGLPSGEALLGDVYRMGLGTAPDTLRAAALYTDAIQKGLHDAEKKLLAMMGRRWTALAADSALAIGKYYYTHGAPVAGVTLFENAAGKGNPEALALLGDAYSRALGVDYSHERSLGYFLKAALLGNVPASFVIAELLDIFPDALKEEGPDSIIREAYAGQEIPPDLYSAAYWYEKAAEGGVTDAAGATGMLLGK